VTEENLKDKAIEYLKRAYGEDTVSMDVMDNSVDEGNGVLHVDCTVSIRGQESDWTKWFTFQNGNVVDMDWRMR
tara:strand:+ start:1523 stop:1744 length:222 start_codon:yes stop_codon:yes gene_type:complete